MRWILILIVLVAVVALTYILRAQSGNAVQRTAEVEGGGDYAKATLAGGCFWCMEPPFERLKGVISVTSGYTGGKEDNPTYKEVASGRTGHTEAIEILFDRNLISYAELLEVFWRNINPTDSAGQFVDRGAQYRSAIFYHDESQREIAEVSRTRLEATGRLQGPIVTEITPAGSFWPAEDYHQDYYKENPIRYKYYRGGSGRDAYLVKTWGSEAGGKGVIERLRAASSPYSRPSDVELKKRLSPLQYLVTQHEGTEPAFDNEHWDEKRPGIYVDIVSGEPLFSSLDKYKSGTGWPSFTRPLVADNIVEREDRKLLSVRVEIRSRHGDSHLGHVFNDGPPPTGLRYCMNSAALRFIPADELQREGYGEFIHLFE